MAFESREGQSSGVCRHCSTLRSPHDGSCACQHSPNCVCDRCDSDRFFKHWGAIADAAGPDLDEGSTSGYSPEKEPNYDELPNSQEFSVKPSDSTEDSSSKEHRMMEHAAHHFEVNGYHEGDPGELEEDFAKVGKNVQAIAHEYFKPLHAAFSKIWDHRGPKINAQHHPDIHRELLNNAAARVNRYQ